MGDVVEHLTYLAILPSQWGVRREVSPERDLWFAVLDTAIRDWERALRGYKVHRREEIEGLMESSSGPGSFEFVCDALGLDAKDLRAKFEGWTVETAPRIARKGPRGDRRKHAVGA